eukprot:714371-Rhodomonas_salina.2
MEGAAFLHWRAVWCYAMSGTDMQHVVLSAYAFPTQCPVLRQHMLLQSPDVYDQELSNLVGLRYLPTRALHTVRY